VKDAYLMVGGASKKNKRVDSDFYPTPPEVTHALMRYLTAPFFEVWEPACGDGAMSKVLSEYGYSVRSSDLRSSGYGESEVNFLNTIYKCDAVITNPPFNLSEKFIRHALNQAPIVAMLLKSQYWHAAKRTKLFVQHPPAYVLPLNWRPDFNGGKNPLMDMLWTIWIEGEIDTRFRIIGKPA